MSMGSDYDKVRRLSDCPLCRRPKLQGTILCWLCHRDQKEANNGGYSASAVEMLNALEGLTIHEMKYVVHNNRSHKPR